MTTIRRISVFSSLVIFLLTAFSFTLNNINYHSQTLKLSIDGTSTLHDWTITSDKGIIQMDLVMTNNKPTGLSSLSFGVPVESLKSGKGAMDKNTYKALKSDKNKTISFVLSSASITPVDAITYNVKALGKLSIAGNTKDTDVSGVLKYNAADASFTLTGTKKMKMTDVGVTPPSVMLGTIKTGNDITISFQSKIIK